ncbi:MAG TPA: rubrerythrin-like domain-containing protein [Phycisphaerae bacterium]|nr:rubrerythrin-like domain-containing protein [Phycisphaerae bacterium]
MSRTAHRGNRHLLERDAEKIAARYLAEEISISGLMRKYQVAYYTLMPVLCQLTTAEQRAAVNRRRKLRCGKKGRFRKGVASWNKGRKGWCPTGSERTWFKAGQMRGAAARNWRPIGTVKIRHDRPAKHLRGRKRKPGLPPWRGKARRWIKVADGGRPQDRWIAYARWVWQQHRGPIAKGLSVVHLDGDILNDRLENLVLLDNRGRIDLQRRRDPEMERRRREACGRAATLRHMRNRGLKELHRAAGRRRLWECHACGYGIEQKDRPGRCPKCGGGTFQKLQTPPTAAG